MKLEFTIPGEPQGKGRPCFARMGNHVRTYTPEKTRKAEDSLVARALTFRPAEPLSGPLYLEVTFNFTVPASWPRWKRDAALAGSYQHVTKPDCDNLLKLLKDALNEVFWLDDKQICNVHAAKYYTSGAGYTRVTIEEIDHVSRKEIV